MCICWPRISPISYIRSMLNMSSYVWYLTKMSSWSLIFKILNLNYFAIIFEILTFSMATLTFILKWVSILLILKPFLDTSLDFLCYSLHKQMFPVALISTVDCVLNLFLVVTASSDDELESELDDCYSYIVFIKGNLKLFNCWFII